jgi:hypothetical protein
MLDYVDRTVFFGSPRQMAALANRYRLTFEDARRIAAAIARIPEFMIGRRGFYSRGPGNYRWSMARPFHVAFEDRLVRTQWDEINVLCKFNGIPFDATGEKVRREGLWCVDRLSRQLEADLRYFITFRD